MGTANPQADWNKVGLLSPLKKLEGTYLLGSGLEKMTEDPIWLCGKYDSLVLSEISELNYQRNRCQTSFDLKWFSRSIC